MIFVQICRFVTMLCCCASVFIISYVAVEPGQPAIAGYVLAIAVVVIPYIFTRSVEGFPFPPEK